MALRDRLVPTVRGIPGVFFFSFDCEEAKHVHVARDRQTCKFWLEPVTLAFNKGFRRHELNRIRQLVSSNLPLILDAWEHHCG